MKQLSLIQKERCGKVVKTTISLPLTLNIKSQMVNKTSFHVATLLVAGMCGYSWGSNSSCLFLCCLLQLNKRMSNERSKLCCTHSFMTVWLVRQPIALINISCSMPLLEARQQFQTKRKASLLVSKRSPVQITVCVISGTLNNFNVAFLDKNKK